MMAARSSGRRLLSGPAVLSLSLVLLLAAAIPVTECQAEDQTTSSIDCSETGRVVREPDGTLRYGALPPTEAPETEEYSPQGLEGWYDMARGFVNIVQPENLPYDVIENSIRESEQECPENNQEENGESCSTDLQTTLQDFGEWWAPLIAVTVLGGVMAFAFLVVGAIFWCCRCCGQCGGSRKMVDPRDKCMFGISIALFLVTLLLFVGVVLSFYSNEQSFDTIENLQTTMNDIVGTAVDYMDAFLDDGDGILCQFIQVTEIAMDETNVLNGSLNELINEVSVDVNDVLQRLDRLSTGINETGDILMNISMTSQALQSAGDMLSNTLDSIAADVSTLSMDCMGMMGMMGVMGCENIPLATTFQPGANYSDLPDVSQELNDVEQSLEGINLQNSIEEGNAEFERVTRDIQSQVNANLGGLDDESSNSSGVLGSLTDANETLFETRDSVMGDVRRVIRNDYDIEDCPDVEEIVNGEAGDVTVDVGFIRQCYINQFFERLEEYDSYRYGFGILICCLALLIVVLTMTGIGLGVAGWRKDRSPDSRTKISHCGGIVLLVDVGLTFIFAFVLLVLACLAFFFGSNLQKICQAIEPPEYEVFSRVVDNRELWGRSLLGEAVLGSGENLSLSGALRACEDDQALYSAFNLSVLFDVRTEVLNTSDIFDDLEQQVTDTIDSFDYTSDSFLDNETRSALNNFTSADVGSINITAFREVLAEDALGFSLTEAIDNLTLARDAFAAIPRTDLVNSTDNIINQLVDIRDNQLPAINSSAELLETQVDQLSTHIDTVVVKTDIVVAEIDGLVMNLTGDDFKGRIRDISIGTLHNLEGYLTSFVNFTTTAIETDVGRCRPLATIYSSAHSVVCNEAVDGLNGYWWSLGFCCLCFIPLIILAVIASTHYLRQKPGYDDSYQDLPLKAR